MAVDEAALTASLITLLSRADLPSPIGERQLLDRFDEVFRATTQVLRIDSAGLMLLDDRNVLRIVGTTDEAGAALEAAQVHLRSGPGIDCLATGRTVAVDDLATSTDYAPVWEWLTRAGEAPDVRSVLSAPVLVSGETVGTLNALHRSPQSWESAQVRAVQAYAGLIGIQLRLGAAARTDGAARPSDPAVEG
jgi:GAF domain-containing protein